MPPVPVPTTNSIISLCVEVNKLRTKSDKVSRISATEKRSQQENILNEIELAYPLGKKIQIDDLKKANIQINMNKGGKNARANESS